MNVKGVVENQKMIFDMLKQTKKQNRLSHAYLFYGEKGTGKKEMAYALACLLYCPNGGCLECDTCRSILEDNHLNVDYIGVEDNKTMISKEQITALQDEFSKTSLVDGTRVYIVDGIDTASTAAQNSLLKFIEDPLNQTPTIGIFVATDLANVVSTIQSRCNLMHFKAIDYDKALAILRENNDYLDSILAANLTNDLDEANAFISSKDFLKLKDIFLDLLVINNEGDAVKYYLQSYQFMNDQKKIAILLQWVILFLEDCNIKAIGNEKLLLEPICDRINMYIKRNEKYLRDRLKIALELFNKLKYNISAKNVFHELIIRFI